MGIFREKPNPLQALNAAEAKKAAKGSNRPSIALIALVTLGTLAYVVVGKTPSPSLDQPETQAPLTKTEHTSTVDAQSSGQPAESSVQLAEAFAQFGEASAKPAEIPTQPRRTPVKVDRSPETQKQRRALLEKLTNSGIFIKAELPGNLPRLWVGPAFHSLEFGTRESYVSVVHAYYLDGSDEYAAVRVIDGKTNKEIGEFTLVAGLKLY